MREIHRREMRAQSYRSKSPMDRDLTAKTPGREEKRFVFFVPVGEKYLRIFCALCVFSGKYSPHRNESAALSQRFNPAYRQAGAKTPGREEKRFVFLVTLWES